MRLIDADATVIGLDTALACSRVVAGKDALQNKALDIFEKARDFVANMPTIDAVPVVHGRWEDIGNDWFDLWRCSACGTEWSFPYDPTSTETRVNYCPDCGARMDGDGDA